MLKPLGDRIVIKALEAETQSSGGIILPDTGWPPIGLVDGHPDAAPSPPDTRRRRWDGRPS